MEAHEYQRLAARTLIDAPEVPFTNEELAIIMATIRVGVIAGQAMDYVKKAICHRHGFRSIELDKIASELSGAAVNLIDIQSDIEADQRPCMFGDNEQMILWTALGLGGECGEALEDAMQGTADPKELGDVCWYLAGLATLTDIRLSDVMTQNIKKLIMRYPNGYSSVDSAARVDLDDIHGRDV